MIRIRTALTTLTTAMLLAVPTTPAVAAENVERAAGCAVLAGYGDGWAEIANKCAHEINATVEVDGFDPDCTRIPGYGVGVVSLESGDVPYYAYEC
ncbi:hypothetical protein ACH492_29260 [Streptomyces sp. NPDC019443]|uniref:hypothetical protein n=1 Tax=Streptomyces sp. NPDC019443 TaxID=3365061 RepID=UPI0037B9F310